MRNETLKRSIAVICISLFHIIPGIPSYSGTLGENSSQYHRRISITIDDLPAPYDDIQTICYVRDNLIPKIVNYDIPVVGFVNERKLYVMGEIDERVAVLEQWYDAGIELGNHTFSHIRIDKASVEEYKTDVIRGETVTSWLMGRKRYGLRYFRHPQLRTGPTPEYKAELDKFLRSRGYTVAPITMDNDEYIFGAIYHRARQNTDSEMMVRIASEYLVYMTGIIDHFEETSIEFLDRNINHILLLHANELNADYFDDLIGLLTNKGYEFIPLEDALSDPAYSLPESCSDRGISWLYRWMIAAGIEPPEQPRPPEAIMELFNTYRR